MKHSEIDNDENSTEEETSETSSEEEEEEILDPVSDKDFFKTLSCLKNKDPKIYDKNVQFFSKSIESGTKKSKNEDTEKSIFVKDYVVGVMDEDSDQETNMPKQLTFIEEQQATKKFFKSELENDSSSEDESREALMKIKVKSKKDKEEEEDEYIQFLKGNKSELGDKEDEKELKPLHDFWNKKDLDENEEFLKDYILNRRYISSESTTMPSYEDLSEDERELEEQAEFENHYNMRFETEENLQIKRFPRKIEGSLRRKDDSRKKKRAEVSQRKKEEKAKKHQDIKRKQKEKLVEIDERIQKLKELTGNPELGFKDDEILEDFDPEKHDKKMNAFFNEEYYNQEEEEHPVFDEEDYNNWDYENINMDCEGNDLGDEGMKLTRSKKKKLKNKKAYMDLMDIAKPSFDPQIHNSFKEYFDEYYNLDCEDFIDDLPCKYKYREVIPNNYGLTVEEILMADDSELNKWASIKKICRLRPEHVEKNEVKIYSNKGHDEHLKRKILCSLYQEDNEDQEKIETTNDKSNNENSVDSLNVGGKKKKKKFKQTSDLEKSTINNNKLEDNDNVNQFISQNDRKHKKQKNNENQNTLSNISNTTENSVMIGKKRKRKYSKVHEPVVSENSENHLIQNEKNNSTEQCFSDISMNEDSYLIKKKKKESCKEEKGVENYSKPVDKQFQGTMKSENYGMHNEQAGNTKKNKRKEKKAGQNNYSNSGNVNVNKHNKNSDQHRIKQFKKKHGNSRDVTELSDNRLRAYGIKPKQFRSKMKYSKRNSTNLN